MFPKPRLSTILLAAALLLTALPLFAAENKNPSETASKPTIGLADDMSDTVRREAARVKENLEQQARSVFKREPLGWDLDTLGYLHDRAVSLPGKIPALAGRLVKQTRLLGEIGMLLAFVFIVAVLYGLFARKRILQWVENKFQRFTERIPPAYDKYFQSVIRVVASALIPLGLLGLFSLISAMTPYHEGWVQLTGRLLGLWAVGAVLLGILREALTRGLFKVAADYGKTLYRWALLTLLYVLAVIGLFWTANAFEIRQDILALFKSAISVSIVVVLFQLFLRKKSILSLFPELPYRGYRGFINFFDTYYFPLIVVSGIAGLLWCSGYKAFGLLLLTKIWVTMAAYLAILLLFHTLNSGLRRWSEKLDASDEAAQLLFRTLKSLLLYATVVASFFIFLNLFGLLNPLQRLMSFGIFQAGDTSVSLWLIIEAILILLIFIFASRILQAYLDYKVYPALKIDPGLAYALNTFFKYITLAVGFLISLKVIGVDLRFLLVFAGAVGIGIGLGLQSMAANVISGFTIIFGGKIRRGDWIETGTQLGMVTDIYLRATKVRTRDNIEFLIPNADLINNTIVNYSLSSPMIRIEVPVGVSYGADPRKVEEIMLHVAGEEPLVSDYEKPVVRFIEYADNSINFELLIWIDVREVPRRKVRSSLYFSLFEAFKKAGIEIPFPQRDIHIKSKLE